MPVVRPLDENRGPSQLHGHGPWLVREVALTQLPKQCNASQIPNQHIQIPSNSSQGTIIEIYHSMGSDSKMYATGRFKYLCVESLHVVPVACMRGVVASEFLGFRSARAWVWERWRTTTRMWRWRIGIWRRTAWSPRGGETRRPARRTVRTWQGSGGSCSPSWSFPSSLSSFFGLYTIPILTLETISRRWTRDSSPFNEVVGSEPTCCK